MDCLCLAGGVALNCVANGKILETAVSKDMDSAWRRAMPEARSARHWQYITAT